MYDVVWSDIEPIWPSINETDFAAQIQAHTIQLHIILKTDAIDCFPNGPTV